MINVVGGRIFAVVVENAFVSLDYRFSMSYIT